MKIVQINVTCGVGSTGKICLAVSELLNGRGVENYILFSEEDSDYEYGIKYADKLSIKLEALKSRVFGNYGFNSKDLTKKLIAKLDEIQPDIVHLHNLHGHGCNLEMLFNYFKKKNIRLYWTFHDCWAFTGHCAYFSYVDCNKWKTGCGQCPQKYSYPASFVLDDSKKSFAEKKRLFTGVENLNIVTPSN